MTPYWICFFYSNLCFPLLFFFSTKMILSIHNSLPWGTLPLCLMLYQNAFVQNPVHLWMATGSKKLTHLLPDHLTCLLRNLYAGQEATVRTRHEHWTGSKLRKESVKGIYCHHACLTYMQSTS